jgi:DNA polymerase-3 subunit delta
VKNLKYNGIKGNSTTKHYSALKVMQIIGKLRETDARLKGINRGNLTDADIMHELLFFILH